MYAIVDLCILCLTSSETLRSIFSKDNDGTVIEDKCKYLLFEFVDIKPEITNNICLSCLQKLNDACTFKQLCIQNINSINNYISTLTKLQEMHKPQRITLNDLKNTAVTHEKENYSNSTKEQLEEDFERTNEDIEVSNNHYIKKEFNMEEEINDVEYELSSIMEIKTEELEEISEKINIKFEKSEDIYEEEPQTENDLNSLLQIDTKKNTDTNLRCTSGGKSQTANKCEECGKSYSSANELKKHRRIHTGEMPFKCSICKQKFSQSSNLVRHKRTHTGEKPHECDMCNKRFTCKSYLIVHKRIHNNERPFQCPICKKNFVRIGSLTEHKRIHTGEKFTCKTCQREFSLLSSLQRHLRNQH